MPFTSYIPSSTKNSWYYQPASNTDDQKNSININEAAYSLGLSKLSVGVIDRSRKTVTSLPEDIETQSLELMLDQPNHLQASQENLYYLKVMVMDSALEVLDKIQGIVKWGREGVNLREEVTNKLLEESGMLDKRLKGNKVATKSDIKACKTFSKHLTKTITDTIRENVGTKDFKSFKFENIIKDELRNEFAIKLGKNMDLWKPLHKTIKIPSEDQVGQFRTYDNNMMPASQMAALAEDYKNNSLHGVSSMSTQEIRHAVNLWTTEFKGFGVEFKGVRHGVNVPFGEKDSNKQITGADRRTHEVITAAADVKSKAIQEHIAKNGLDVPFTLTIVSSSLLTPSEGLKYKKYETGQQDAWQRAMQKSKNGELIVKIPNENGQIQEVKIKLDVLSFSFGVNGLAKLESSAPVALKLLNSLPNVDVSGWKWADKHNAPLFDKLLDSAHKVKEEGQKERYNRIQAYASQIKAVVNSGKHHKDNGNAYALPVLVSLLSNELGAVPAWNCMSGKDRTGYLDAKIKETLVLQDLLGGNTVLDQFSGMTKARPEILEHILFESGSLEIQRACTGVAGYKVNEGKLKIMGKEVDLSVQSNRKNLRPAAAALLEGLSGAVKA